MNKKSNKISQEFEKAIKAGIFPGAVFLCAVKDKIVFHEAFGMADIFEKRPMLKNSIFDLASLTKPLAAGTAIVKLIEKQKLDLSTPISHILKEFKHTDKADITIDMLLRHTSGLPAHRKYYSEILKPEVLPDTLSGTLPETIEGKPEQCLMHLLLQEKIEYIPGERQVYSDIGFMILARIIKHVSGIRLDDFVFKEIYKPLGIKDLFFIDLHSEKRKYYSNNPRLVSTRYCKWRKKVLRGEVDDDNAFAVGGIDGHAGLFGDAESVWLLCLEILKALQNDSPEIFRPDIMRRFVKENKTRAGKQFEKVAAFDTPSVSGSSSGRFFSKSSIGHLGFTGTSFWLDPENGWIVILLTNRVHPDMNNAGIKEFRPFIHDLAWQEIGLRTEC